MFGFRSRKRKKAPVSGVYGRLFSKSSATLRCFALAADSSKPALIEPLTRAFTPAIEPRRGWY